MPSTVDGGAATTGSMPLEVCPPSLLDDDFAPTRSGLRSLLPRLDDVRDWLHTGWYGSDAGPADWHRPRLPAADSRLAAARSAFAAALGDLDQPNARDLAARARVAPALRELWHLRNELFTLVALHHCESVAHARLAQVNTCFSVRARRLSRTGPPHPHQELRP